MACNTIMASVLTHEIGHNFGCAHDREFEGIPEENEYSNFGFNNCDTCSTSIMSYQDYCISQGFCEKVIKHPYFSNPDIKITTQGKTFAIGDSKRNNAQMIRNSKKAVAANYDKNQNIFDLEYTSYEYDEYGWYYYIEFIVEGVTAVAIKNLEIHMITSETQTISVFTKPINTEDDYSLHVEENLVPMGQESDLFKNVASFDKFPAIKIGAGEKMKIKVSCDTNCIKFNIVNDSMLVKGDHI